MNLGKALKTLREARGMTQEQMAVAMKAAHPEDWEGEAHEIDTFETHAEWSVKGIAEEFAAALHIPVSVLTLFAASDDELGHDAALGAQVRQLALELMHPEETQP